MLSELEKKILEGLQTSKIRRHKLAEKIHEDLVEGHGILVSYSMVPTLEHLIGAIGPENPTRVGALAEGFFCRNARMK